MTKKCTACKKDLAFECFIRDKRSKTGRMSQCKQCRSSAAKVWRSKNRDRVKEKARERYQEKKSTILDQCRRSYNKHKAAKAAKAREYRIANKAKLREKKWAKQGIDITYSQYLSLLKNQDNKCYICRNESEALVVDHNHETGAVRGLLCSKCNLGLGNFDDNPARLKRAVQYLAEFPPDEAQEQTS